MVEAVGIEPTSDRPASRAVAGSAADAGAVEPQVEPRIAPLSPDELIDRLRTAAANVLAIVPSVTLAAGLRRALAELLSR